MFGYIKEKLVYRFKCGKLPAESAGMKQRYVMYRSENTSISRSETETPQTIWIQQSIHTNYTFAVNNDYMIICTTRLTIKQQLAHVHGECQWNVNDFWSCKQVN
jgi:hypothetical protein